MKLGDLLSHEMTCGLSVINENADLNRKVYTIESTETPDAFSYVGSNSFIVTTAMVYQHNQEELAKLIEKLNDKPCAGLGIKLGRFIDKLDARVIERADALGFPLVLIPKDKTLGDIYQHLLSILWNNQNTELLEALNLKRKLYELVINGATLERILSNTSKSIKKSLVVVDIFGEVCAKGGADRETADIALKYVAEHREELQKLVHAEVTEAEGYFMFIYPIRSISGNTHYLTAFGQESRISVSSYVMEEIILLLQVILYKSLFTIFNDIQMRNDLSSRLVNLNGNGEKYTLSQIFVEGKKYGLKVSSHYRVVVGRFLRFYHYKFSEIQFMQREEKYILGFEMVKKVLKRKYHDSALVLADIENWQFIILFQDCEDDKMKGLNILAKELQSTLKEKLVLTVGEKVYGVASIGTSYWKLKEGLDCLKEEPSEQVLNYQPLSAGELLKSISKKQSQVVCKELLKDLAYPDNDQNIELRRTLKTYLESRCSIVETANRMYVHRNTIRYRIKKCETILGKPLDGPEFCFEIQLALRLSESE